MLTELKRLLQKLLPPTAPDDPNQPVVIATFAPTEQPLAEICRSRLEEAGILAYTSREVAYSADPIRLFVRRADLAEARAILAEVDE